MRNKLKRISLMSAIATTLLFVSGCGTLSSKPLQLPTSEAFKNSFYREFPTPPLKPVQQQDMVIFWCVNRPLYVEKPEACNYDLSDV